MTRVGPGGWPTRTGPLLGLLLCLPTSTPGGVPAATGQAPPETVLGRPSGIRSPEPVEDWVFVEEETRLHRLPDRHSAVLAILGVAAPRQVEEREGAWVRIRVDGQAGWVIAVDGRAGPDLEAPPARTFLEETEEPLRPDPERLARALNQLQSPTRLEAGAVLIHTDLTDPDALRLASRLAEGLPTAYRHRYGLSPREDDRYALVLYSREESYRRLEQTETDLGDLETEGHAAGNLALAFAGDRATPELAPILLHEMTHLLNRSVFRGRIPAWLEEGLAEDMSFSRVDAEGRIEPHRLGGRAEETRYTSPRRDHVVRELWGAPASLRQLVTALRQGDLPPLVDLLALPSAAMVRPEGRALRYAQSAFLLRCLLDDGRAGRRPETLTFLGRVADGGPGEGEELAAALDTDWTDLERWFAGCIVRRSRGL